MGSRWPQYGMGNSCEQINDKQVEIWKPVKDLEGCYEVSNMGRIKSLRRKTKQKHRNGKTMEVWYGGKILKPCGKPYLHVHLGGYRRAVRVHVLVAEHFLGPKPAKGIWDVDHINNIKTDNRACNLQWLIRKENCYIKPQRRHDSKGRFIKKNEM